MDTGENAPNPAFKRRQQAEEVVNMKPTQGGFWYSIADCQRMVHELQVSQIEMTLISEEFEQNKVQVRAWRQEAKRLQSEFKKASEIFSAMAEGPERDQVAMRCMHETLHLFEEGFKLLIASAGDQGDE